MEKERRRLNFTCENPFSSETAPSRTDVAAERMESLPKSAENSSGIRSQEKLLDGGKLFRVEILDQRGAERLGKPIGNYVTLRLPPFGRNAERSGALTEAAAQALRSMLPDGSCLVIGLGNQSITPDALGPLSVRKIFPTRHVTGKATIPGLEGLRPVSVLAPGVLGQTGMEAAEIATALVRLLHPACLIAVDALAAGSREWLACTVQMTDTGVSPGSGVQNSRKELSASTLGIPVVAVGVPTVMDAPLLPGEAPMIVTPREIDRLIEDAADFIAMTVNRALFPSLSEEEIRAFVN